MDPEGQGQCHQDPAGDVLGRVRVCAGGRQRRPSGAAWLASPTRTALQAGLRFPLRSHGMGARFRAQEIASTLTGNPARKPALSGNTRSSRASAALFPAAWSSVAARQLRIYGRQCNDRVGGLWAGNLADEGPPWRNQPAGPDQIGAGQSSFWLLTEGRPQQDSNLRTRLRRPLLYPLSYGGSRRPQTMAAVAGLGYQP
jgi:hypothetical protein